MTTTTQRRSAPPRISTCHQRPTSPWNLTHLGRWQRIQARTLLGRKTEHKQWCPLKLLPAKTQKTVSRRLQWFSRRCGGIPGLLCHPHQRLPMRPTNGRALHRCASMAHVFTTLLCEGLTHFSQCENSWYTAFLLGPIALLMQCWCL